MSIDRKIIDKCLDEMEANGDEFIGMILIGVNPDGNDGIGAIVGVNPVDTNAIDLAISGAEGLLQRWKSL